MKDSKACADIAATAEYRALPSAVEKAVFLHQRGVSMCRAGRFLGINKNRVSRAVNAALSKREIGKNGRPSPISRVKDALTEWVDTKASENDAKSRMEVAEHASVLLDIKNADGEPHVPSLRTIERHIHRPYVKAETRSLQKEAHRPTVLAWHDEMKDKYKVDLIIQNTPALAFFSDETRVEYVANGKGSAGCCKVYCGPMGKKAVKKVDDADGISFTSFNTADATGQALPAFLVFDTMPTDALGNFDHLILDYGKTESSFTTAESIFNWGRERLVPEVKQRRQRLGLPDDAPAMILLDCASNRYNPQFAKLCNDNHIVVPLIPPNAGTSCDPWDCGLNGACKMLLKKELPKFLARQKALLGRALTLPEKRVAVVATWDKVYYLATYKGRIKDAARKAAVVPWDRSVLEGKTTTLPVSPLVAPPGKKSLFVKLGGCMTSETSKLAFAKQKEEKKAKAHAEYKRLEAKIDKATKNIADDTSSIANAEKEVEAANAALHKKRNTHAQLREKLRVMRSRVQRDAVARQVASAAAAVKKVEELMQAKTKKLDDRLARKRKHEDDLKAAVEAKKKKKDSAAAYKAAMGEDAAKEDDEDDDDEDDTEADEDDE